MFEEKEEGIYPQPATGHQLSDQLTIKDCSFDVRKGSRRRKEEVPYLPHMAPRGALAIRAVNKSKRNEERP